MGFCFFQRIVLACAMCNEQPIKADGSGASSSQLWDALFLGRRSVYLGFGLFCCPVRALERLQNGECKLAVCIASMQRPGSSPFSEKKNGECNMASLVQQLLGSGFLKKVDRRKSLELYCSMRYAWFCCQVRGMEARFRNGECDVASSVGNLSSQDFATKRSKRMFQNQNQETEKIVFFFCPQHFNVGAEVVFLGCPVLLAQNIFASRSILQFPANFRKLHFISFSWKLPHFCWIVQTSKLLCQLLRLILVVWQTNNIFLGECDRQT